MADYYPLLARALDALPDRSPGLRRAVYDRARNALISQLRSLEPPLSEDDIDLERRALDAAIERLEVEHGGIPAPANDAAKDKPEPVAPPPAAPSAPKPIPEPASQPEPAQPPAEPKVEPLPEAERPQAAPVEEPALPAASSPRFVLTPEPVAEKPREAAVAFAPPKSASVQDTEFASTVPNTSEPVAPPQAEELDAGSDLGQGRQRPRIAVVAPRAGRSKILRNLLIGTVLVAVIGAIAVAAFLLRDKPQTAARLNSDPVQQIGENPDTKFNDRVGGEAAPAERPKPKQDGAAPRTQAPAVPEQPTVAVAKRAFLIEESNSAENSQPQTTPGRVTWRLDTANGEQDQPLQTSATAVVSFLDGGLTLTMTIQKNLDATLPASHTVSLSFTESGPDAASRTVQDVGLLQAKDDENSRGSPVSGLPVRVRDNLFLIGCRRFPPMSSATPICSCTGPGSTSRCATRPVDAPY